MARASKETVDSGPNLQADFRTSESVDQYVPPRPFFSTNEEGFGQEHVEQIHRGVGNGKRCRGTDFPVQCFSNQPAGYAISR